MQHIAVGGDMPPGNPRQGDDAKGRLQVSFFSATLHAQHIADLSAKICHHPTWVDLKGKDAVPETVHHVVAAPHGTLISEVVLRPMVGRKG